MFMARPNKFGARDQAYLRDEQYKDGTNLTARANLHAKYRTAPIDWFPWLVQRIPWPEHGDVLEVGCGTGLLWPHVTVPLRLTLTDLSPGMVAEATERVAARDNIILVRAEAADIGTLPFDDASFDLVIANHMLYHVPDLAQAVRELRRVLRPGGVLSAATVGHEHLRELFEIEESIFGARGHDGIAEAFGAANGAQILAAEFGHVEWHEYEDELHCTDADDVIAHIASTPPAADAETTQRQQLRDAVVARMAAAGGVLKVTKESGVFLARTG